MTEEDSVSFQWGMGTQTLSKKKSRCSHTVRCLVFANIRVRPSPVSAKEGHKLGAPLLKSAGCAPVSAKQGRELGTSPPNSAPAYKSGVYGFPMDSPSVIDSQYSNAYFHYSPRFIKMSKQTLQ